MQDVMNMMADEKQGGLSELDIAYILKSVLAGLQYLHSHKIIHKYVISPKIVLTEHLLNMNHLKQRLEGGQYIAK